MKTSCMGSAYIESQPPETLPTSAVTVPKLCVILSQQVSESLGPSDPLSQHLFLWHGSQNSLTSHLFYREYQKETAKASWEEQAIQVAHMALVSRFLAITWNQAIHWNLTSTILVLFFSSSRIFFQFNVGSYFLLHLLFSLCSPKCLLRCGNMATFLQPKSETQAVRWSDRLCTSKEFSENLSTGETKGIRNIGNNMSLQRENCECVTFSWLMELMAEPVKVNIIFIIRIWESWCYLHCQESCLFCCKSQIKPNKATLKLKRQFTQKIQTTLFHLSKLFWCELLS